MPIPSTVSGLIKEVIWHLAGDSPEKLRLEEALDIINDVKSIARDHSFGVMRLREEVIIRL